MASELQQLVPRWVGVLSLGGGMCAFCLSTEKRDDDDDDDDDDENDDDDDENEDEDEDQDHDR